MRRGVTLMEMLVVVAIIALVAAVALPSVAAGIDSVRLKTASDSVAGFLNAAVNRAERLQFAEEVDISPKAGKLTLISSEKGFRRELEMPSGISIEAVLPRQLAAVDDDSRRVLLMPGAAIPAIGVVLVNQHGGRRMIRLDPMTGFPRIESVVKEE